MASNATEKREREMVNDCECALADDYAWDDAMRKDAGGNDVRANLCAHHSLSLSCLDTEYAFIQTHTQTEWSEDQRTWPTKAVRITKRHETYREKKNTRFTSLSLLRLHTNNELFCLLEHSDIYLS